MKPRNLSTSIAIAPGIISVALAVSIALPANAQGWPALRKPSKPGDTVQHQNGAPGRQAASRTRIAQAEGKPQPTEDSETMKKADKLYGQGLLEQAAEQYREVIRQEPDNAKAHQRLGAVLAGLASDAHSKTYDDYDTAILEEKQASKLDPKSHLPHVILGQIYTNQKKLDDAIREFTQACANKPTSYKSHLDLGVAYTSADRLDDAVAAFQKATKIKPDEAAPYVNIGIALQAKGDFKGALEAAKKGISILESSNGGQRANLPAAYFNIGNIYADAGQADEALSSYEKSLKLMKGNPYALSGIGWMQARKGNYDEAVRIQRKVLKDNPDFTLARGRLATALADQGKSEEARKEFEKCMKSPNKDAISMVEYGRFLEKEGKKTEARAIYQQALKAQPTFKQAKEELARLETGKQLK